MNLYRFEVRRLRGSMAGWAIAVCCFLGIYLGMYPLFTESGSMVAALFAKFPETLRSLYGMTDLDLSSVAGYLPFPLKLIEELLAVGGLMLGVRICAHDTKEKCADFLYSKPVSRSFVFGAKTWAAITMGGWLFCVLVLVTGGIAAAVAPGELPLRNLIASALIVLLLFWLYAAAGFLIGTRFPKIRGTAAIGVGAMFFFHIVFSICKVITKDAGCLAARLLVPVLLFDRDIAARQGRIEWPFLAVWCAETALLLFFAYRIGQRRDIVSG